MEEVTIGHGVKRIGEEAFVSCPNLARLDLGDGVEEIGKDAFYESCGALKFLVIPDSVTTIGEDAFGGCKNLVELVIGGGLTSLDSFWFDQNPVLASVAIGNSVTNIPDELFEKCVNLASVTLGHSVASIGDWAFSGCTRLKTLTLPSSVTSVGYGAFDKSGLAKLYVPASWKGTAMLDEADLPSGCTVIYSGQEPPPDPQPPEPQPATPYAAWLSGFGKTEEEMPESGDADNDGATNWEEFIADTDPCDGSDIFKTQLLRGDGALVLSASSVSTGRTYGVWVHADLLSPGQWHPLEVGGEGLRWTFTPGENMGFGYLTVALPE